MHKRDPSGKARPRRTALPRGMQPELLLYVEDDDDNWEVAELRLGKTYELLRARNDEEACALIRARRSEIHIILMDIELRGSQLNGVELTELLRGNSLPHKPQLPVYAQGLPVVSKPVIYVTANGARYTSAQLMVSGADKVISKPVDFRQLQMALAELLMDSTAS